MNYPQESYRIIEYTNKNGEPADYYSARYAYIEIDGHKVQLLVHRYPNGDVELKYN